MDQGMPGIRGGYDRWAPIYDHDGNPLVALEDPLVRAALGDPRGLKVLDLGCGTGRHALALAAAGAEVTALDFSEGMLAEARGKPGSDRVQFLVHDLQQPLPFPAGSFHRVVSGLVLEHLSDLPGLFREVHRVLNPTGQAVISAMHPGMFDYGVQAAFTDPVSGVKLKPGSQAHSLEAFLAAASGAGFDRVRLSEHAPDLALAARFPRAAKHLGRPMLVVLELAKIDG